MTYRTVHERLKKTYGPARDHLCSWCLGPADEWAFMYLSPPLFEGKKTYTDNLEDYTPLCRKHHRTLDRNSYLENGHNRGVQGGAILAEKVKSDPAFREEVTARVRPHHEKMRSDPNTKKVYSDAMRRTNSRRRKCLTCGLTSAPGNIGKHLQATGHAGYEEVTP